jgi:hypothetical protein
MHLARQADVLIVIIIIIPSSHSFNAIGPAPHTLTCLWDTDMSTKLKGQSGVVFACCDTPALRTTQLP